MDAQRRGTAPKRKMPVIVLNFAVASIIALIFVMVMLKNSLFSQIEEELEEPFFYESTLFEAGERGYPVIRIPGLVVTSKGTLITYAEARSSHSDWSIIDLVMKRSTDGGKTWEPMTVLVQNGLYEEITYNNPLMIAERDSETVHFLYGKNYHELFYMKSTNGGLDWSEPVNITETTLQKFRDEGKPEPYAWKVVASGPGHGIQLRNGRLIVPIWLANGATDRSHGPSVAATIYSDDYGQTWHAGEIIYSTSLITNLGEPTAVELEDGSVMMNMRNPGGLRAVSISPDGISGWSRPAFDNQLIDPNNFGSLVRYSFEEESGKSRILFINANDAHHRRNITLRMSIDEGKTWTYSRTIQPGQGQYAEVGVAPDGTIHILYERGYGINAVRVNAAWLTTNNQLERLQIDGGELQPAFNGTVFDYEFHARKNVEKIRLSANLPDHSDAEIWINGVKAGSSVFDFEAALSETEETLIKLEIIDSKEKLMNYYHILVKKVLPEGMMVGYYDFEKISEDGQLFDQSGLENHGKVHDARPANGRIGQGLHLINGHVDIEEPTGMAFGNGDFTVALWVKPDRLDEFMHMLWYGDVGSGANGWYLRTQQFNKLYFRTGGGGFETLSGTGEVLTAGTWHHIVAKRKGNEMALFVDGQKLMSKITTDIYNVNGANLLRIGKAMGGDARYWAGVIDELRIYNYALSEAEIWDLYEGELKAH